MQYLTSYNQFKEWFNVGTPEIGLPGTATVVRTYEFHSHIPPPSEFADMVQDQMISENNCFRYPVIIPGGADESRNVIILLHGLNERNWYKHLPGAQFLAEKLSRPVILFPLSFHINRGLPDWTNARIMAAKLEKRIKKFPGVQDATIANLALSERLTEYPERFFLAGLQSAHDLIHLLTQLKEGIHPLFRKNTRADIFAYSISCMLLQAMMISNPNQILSQSRIVFFAGGSLLSHIQGVSRYIMDSVAFESVRRLYLDNRRRKEIFRKGRSFETDPVFGTAFRAVLAPHILTNVRERRMERFRNQLMVVALRDDKVIPLEGIRKATGDRFFRSSHFRVLHFPYPYSHENPFPINRNQNLAEVDKAFQSVFTSVLDFYAT